MFNFQPSAVFVHGSTFRCLCLSVKFRCLSAFIVEHSVVGSIVTRSVFYVFIVQPPVVCVHCSTIACLCLLFNLLLFVCSLCVHCVYLLFNLPLFVFQSHVSLTPSNVFEIGVANRVGGNQKEVYEEATTPKRNGNVKMKQVNFKKILLCFPFTHNSNYILCLINSVSCLHQ